MFLPCNIEVFELAAANPGEALVFSKRTIVPETRRLPTYSILGSGELSNSPKKPKKGPIRSKIGREGADPWRPVRSTEARPRIARAIHVDAGAKGAQDGTPGIVQFNLNILLASGNSVPR